LLVFFNVSGAYHITSTAQTPNNSKHKRDTQECLILKIRDTIFDTRTHGTFVKREDVRGMESRSTLSHTCCVRKKLTHIKKHIILVSIN
jgi:hypothetical protein